MFNELLKLGYIRERLIYNFNKVVRRDNLCDKYGDGCKDIIN